MDERQLGYPECGQSTILYRAGELVPVKAPLDRDGDSFDSGSYQHETCTQNWIRLDNPLRLLVTPLWDESGVHVYVVQTEALSVKFV